MFDPSLGVELAAELADGAATMSQLPAGQAGLGRLVDLAVLATRVQAWAGAMKAAATSELDARIGEEHRADLAELAAVRGRPATARERSQAQAATDRQVTATLSLSQGISLPVADRQLDLARATREHPDLHEALGQGRLDLAQTEMIVRQLRAVPDPTHRTRLIQGLLADPDDQKARLRLFRELRTGARLLWQLPPGKLRTIVTRQAALLDPDTLTRQAGATREARSVEFYPTSIDQHMAALVIRGPAHELTAAAAHLDAQARAARNAGAPQTLDQLRYDLTIAHLTAGTHGLTLTHPDHTHPDHTQPPTTEPTAEPTTEPTAKPSATKVEPATDCGPRTMTLPPLRGTTLIHILVPDRTLLGHDDDPATLTTPHGEIPIPAHLARELAHDPHQATWQRILIDPTTGTATDISPTYHPPTRIATWCKARDGYQTRFPTSTARHLELNHIQPYNHHNPAAGGPTTGHNLAAEGKRTHQSLTEHGTHVTGNANHCLTYHTGTGHTYQSWPHPYLDPHPPPPQPQPPDLGDPPF